MKRLVLIIPVIVCFLSETNGQIINVPAGQPTIQAGIDSAANGDTVLVAEGTYFENINFKGKAITVASLFVLDGDTSHIRKTVIDGSQSTKPDTGSVVLMISGEDTTSVLMGFTITGGTGTYITSYYGQPIINLVHGGEWTQLTTQRVGGGIFITGSGGKITNNIIEKNHVEDPVSENTQFGGGIHAHVFNNHSLIIRKNILRYNTVTGTDPCGGGISAAGGRIICEYNEITNNTVDGVIISLGGGIQGLWFDLLYGIRYYEGVVKEAIIRNNRICDNSATSDWENGGGAYAQLFGYGEEYIQVYNNIICNNYSNAGGGALAFHHYSEGRFFNNTIVDNTAGWDANCIEVAFPKHIALYNNILYRYVPSTKKEYWFGWTEPGNLLFFNNIILQPFTNQDPVTAFYNLEAEPVFQNGAFELAEGSPGIGWGRDSVKIEGTWYYAPHSDIFGNKRPDPVDPYMEAGAVESAFPRPVYHNANLTHIGLWNRKLDPDFHQDTLHYVLPVPDTTVVTPQLDVIPWDWLAEIDINNAPDIGSPDPADRTTTITVTADDGYTQKIYTVLFRLYPFTDATLDTLYTDRGYLDPVFQPETFIYTACIPYGTTKTPGVYFKTTAPLATFKVTPASCVICLQRAYRTTIITVMAEDGKNTEKYEIEFIVDKIRPTITLLSDTVSLNDSIQVTSTENGHVYLLPESTTQYLDSVLAHCLYSTGILANDTAFIPVADLIPGTYWLYAIDSCQSVSAAVTVAIIDTADFIHETAITSVSLYPIPVDQVLYIKTDQAISSVELFNVIGVKIMHEVNVEGQINMSQLKQGIYFIRIKTDRGEVYTGKVVKK